MARAISLVHLEGSPEATRRLMDALEAESLAGKVTNSRDLAPFHAALQAPGADIALVSFGVSCKAAATTVRRTRGVAPDVPVVALLETEDPATELEVLMAGAIDCLSPSRAGRLGWVLKRALAQRDESVRREGVQSEINSLEAQLHHAQRLTNIATLAGGVAHDFNNLLTIINGCCQLLLRSLPEGHELRPLVEPMEQAGARGAELTKRLLSFSRQEPSSATLLNLNDVITGVQPILAPLLGETVRLSLNLDPSLWLVRADSGEVSQVLMNLVTNARDAMPDGGTVSIRTANVDWFSGAGGPVTESYVELVVRDAGCGMTETVRARIFDPFFTTKASGQGTGLGLATVQRIVNQHGGEIDVETAPGRGTSMRVRLPRAEPGESIAQPSTRDELVAPAGTETVLVVEDSDAIRNLVVEEFKVLGYTVLEADRGDAALEIEKGHDGPIHLLVSDVMMPGMNGVELARSIREKRPDVQIIFLSGFVALDINERMGRELGAVFVSKPFALGVLAKAARQLLEPKTATE
jgi:two-component system cell cycle sensor histidine kinase/response regulator CckA